MSIIQSIRERGALISAIVIALALLGFILMDAFSGKSNLFGEGGSNTLAVVNGQKIEYREFEEKVKAQEQSFMQMGYSGEQARQQAINALWNEEVNALVMRSEFEKLGMKIGDKELSEEVYGNPHPQYTRLQQFMDQQTGQFSFQAYHQYIQYLNANKNRDPRVRQEYDFVTNYAEHSVLMEKYNALAAAASYLPKWFIEKQNTENSGLAKISYVRVPYESIDDSTIQVSDKEIEEYIKKHKNRYQQKESRTIEYVKFNASPSSGDSAGIRNQLESIKAEFVASTNPGAFINKYGSITQFFDGFVSKSKMEVPYTDSLQALAKNEVFGPYIDGVNYVLAKMIDVKQLPDSVKCRHVLISTNVQDGGFEDSVASKIIDSIAKAINGGASWADMVQKYNPVSDGSRANNGEMTFSSFDIQQSNFAKEFGDFILFNGKKGERKTVKTSFGYHFIEIMDLKKIESHYKIAYLTKPIDASRETDNAAQNAAIRFAGEARNPKAFDEYFKKNLEPQGITKLPVTVGPEEYDIMGVGVSRSLVRDIYKAKKGEVLQPVRVGDDYVVAVVTDINEEGLQPVNKARPLVEPFVRNEKKAEQIVKNIGAYTNLEEVATKTGFPVTNEDSVRFSTGVLSQEPKLIGASFNPDIAGKVLGTPIKGGNGVYVLKVNELTTTPVPAANIEEQQRLFRNGIKQNIQRGYYGRGMENTPIAVLRKVAKIKDKRNDYY